MFYYITTAVNVVALYLPGIIMAAFFPDKIQTRTVRCPSSSASGCIWWSFPGLQESLAVWYCAYKWPTATPISSRSGTNCGPLSRNRFPARWVGANPLARTISRIAPAAIMLSLLPFWGVVVYDIHAYGVRQSG